MLAYTRGRTASRRSMFGVPENWSSERVKRTHFQRLGNPAVEHSENVQADLGRPTLWRLLDLKRSESVRTSIGLTLSGSAWFRHSDLRLA
jgi:hypothetical protein